MRSTKETCFMIIIRIATAHRLTKPAFPPPRPNRTLRGTNVIEDMAPARSSICTSGCSFLAGKACVLLCCVVVSGGASLGLPPAIGSSAPDMVTLAALGCPSFLAVLPVDGRRRCRQRRPPSSSSDCRPSVPYWVIKKKKLVGKLCLSMRCRRRLSMDLHLRSQSSTKQAYCMVSRGLFSLAFAGF